MAESLTHILLVQEIVKWVQNEYDNVLPTWIDCPNKSFGYSQPKIGLFVPDYYAQIISKPNKFVIGESKTPNDLRTKHTEEQFKSFLVQCNINKNTELVITVPWNYERFTKNFINSLMIENEINDIKVTILGCLLKY